MIICFTAESTDRSIQSDQYVHVLYELNLFIYLFCGGEREGLVGGGGGYVCVSKGRGKGC